MPAPDAPSLAPGEVHLWRGSLEQPPGVLRRLEATLAPDEQARASRFRDAGLGAAFTASRGIQRDIFARYARVAAERLTFDYSHNGKPALDPNPLDLRFNLSNAGGLALYAVTIGTDIGIDIEPIRAVDDALQLANRFFSTSEIDTLSTLTGRERDVGFLSCWTRKEAYIKAVGEGLALPLDAFTVSLRAGEAARLIETRPDPGEAGRWSMAAFQPQDGYVGAVVVAGKMGRLRYWEWRAQEDVWLWPT